MYLDRSKPYVSLRVGGQEVRTTAAKHGGSNPVWGQTLRINVNHEEELHLEVKVRGGSCNRCTARFSSYNFV